MSFSKEDKQTLRYMRESIIYNTMFFGTGILTLMFWYHGDDILAYLTLPLFFITAIFSLNRKKRFKESTSY